MPQVGWFPRPPEWALVLLEDIWGDGASVQVVKGSGGRAEQGSRRWTRPSTDTTGSRQYTRGESTRKYPGRWCANPRNERPAASPVSYAKQGVRPVQGSGVSPGPLPHRTSCAPWVVSRRRLIGVSSTRRWDWSSTVVHHSVVAPCRRADQCQPSRLNGTSACTAC